MNFLRTANKKSNNYNDSLLQPPPFHLPSTCPKKMRDCFKLIYDFKNDLTLPFHTQTHTRTYARKNIRPLYSVLDEMHCAIWYQLYSLKNVKKHTWRNVTFSKIAKSHSSKGVFTFFKLYK